jgi:hypothetical protein
MSNFDKIVELRGKWFTSPYPADTIVEVSSLYSPEAMIEIEAIAVSGSEIGGTGILLYTLSQRNRRLGLEWSVRERGRWEAVRWALMG